MRYDAAIIGAGADGLAAAAALAASGARVIVLGHTRDDALEAALMRREGASLGDPREWGISLTGNF